MFLRVLADDKGFQADLVKKSEKAGDAAGKTLGQRMGAGVTTLTTGAGAAIGTFVAGSVQEFARFDDAMRQVFSIMPGISAEAMDKMAEDVKGVSAEYGILTDELIPALGTAIGSGIPEGNVMEFLRVAAKAAKAGATDAETSVKALSATINAFQIPVEDANKVADSFFNAIDKGVTTFPELSASMSQVAPVAAAMGISLDEVLAAITAMTLQGEPTAGAVTKVTASLTALQRTTPEMAEALKNLGFETGQAAIDALGYQGTMEALRAEADRMGVPLIKLTGRLEGSGAMLQLTGDNALRAQEILGSFGDTTGKVDAAFEVMEGGIGGATRRMLATIKGWAVGVGAEFAALGPVFTLFGNTAGRAIGAGLGAGVGFVAPKLAAGVKGLWTRAAASSVVTRAVAFAGGKAATVYLSALIAGDAIGGALTNAWAKVAASGPVSAATAKAGTFLGTTVGKAFSVAFAAAATIGIVLALKEIGTGAKEEFDKALFGEDRAARAKEFERILREEGMAAATAYVEGLSSVESAIDGMVIAGDSVLDGLGDVGDAAKDMGQDVETGADRAAGAMTGASRTIIRTAREMVTQLRAQVDALITGYFDPIETRADIYQSRLAQNAAEEALRDAKTAREKRQATDDILSSIRRQADGLSTLGEQGDLTEADIKTFEKNVKASFTALGQKVPVEIAEIIKSLRRLDKWDGKTVTVKVKSTYTGPRGGGYEIRHSGGQVQADRPYIVGRVGAEELFIPNVSGRIAAIPEIRAAVAGGGTVGGASTTVNLTMPVARAPDPFETARQLRRLADFGVLRPTDG